MGPSLMGVAAGLLVLGAAFAFLERRWPAVAQPGWRSGSATDVAYWFFTPLVTKTLTRVAIVLALVAVALALGLPVDQPSLESLLAPRAAIARQPLWLQLVEFLLVADVAAYAMHRLFHRRPLWRFHAVHHSSEQVDWLSAVRLHPVNDLVMRLAQAAPILAIGFDPALLAAYVPLLSAYGVFVHANVPWTFGPFRFAVASPAFHRWHHAAEEQGLDRNFAGLFPFIDLAFGTYHLPRDRAPTRFGIPGGDVPAGLWAQLGYPFKRASEATARRR
ncbi:MAG TPA: sterol desaturase family protein [Candidatus Binatia bacterium]|nr:sterol desaturase family protein [Candidatus Binatia bacterium]